VRFFIEPNSQRVRIGGFIRVDLVFQAAASMVRARSRLIWSSIVRPSATTVS
jgi:hypothetical protein